MRCITGVIVVGLIWSSCAMDYSAGAEIENGLINDIEVTFYYSAHFLDSTYQGDRTKYSLFMKDNIDYRNRPYRLDTQNRKITYLLKHSRKLLVSHVPGGWTVKPDYSPFDSIRINTGNKIITRPVGQLRTMFKERETRLWVWKIE